MKLYTYVLVLLSSFCALGIALPQCSPTEEQKKQTLLIETTQQEMNQKIATLGQETKDIALEVNRIKLLIPEMTHILEAQKKGLEDLALQVQAQAEILKQIEARLPPAKKPLKRK